MQESTALRHFWSQKTLGRGENIWEDSSHGCEDIEKKNIKLLWQLGDICCKKENSTVGRANFYKHEEM